MFVVTLNKTSLKKVGAGALCCALVIFSAFLGRYISTRTVAAAAGVNRIESAQDIQTWFTGYGLDVDGTSITADKVKTPASGTTAFRPSTGWYSKAGMDLTRYKGKTVEKWTALIPAASAERPAATACCWSTAKRLWGPTCWKSRRHGDRPEGCPDRNAQAEQQDAQQVSGEDYSGDWGERHDEELGAAGRASRPAGSQTPWCPRRRSTPTCPWMPRGILSNESGGKMGAKLLFNSTKISG